MPSISAQRRLSGLKACTIKYSAISISVLLNLSVTIDSYSDLALCPYEHWNEEVWIDVSSSRWQSFVVDELITSLAGKEIDGFFVDNCDVYYVNPIPEIMDGLTVMLRAMIDTGLDVIITPQDETWEGACVCRKSEPVHGELSQGRPLRHIQ